MRTLAVLSITLLALGLGSCARQDTDAGRNTEKLRGDANSAARKAGKAAHELAIESREAAKKTAHELDELGKEAHKGWTEAHRDDHDKDKK
jgi:hypothetical protein